VTPLAPRLEQVVRYLADGLENKEIAAEMGISIKTVDCYMAKLIDIAGVRGRRLVLWALLEKIERAKRAA
jgi:DNA-binding NarL/FixJ family response regulator